MMQTQVVTYSSIFQVELSCGLQALSPWISK